MFCLLNHDLGHASVAHYGCLNSVDRASSNSEPRFRSTLSHVSDRPRCPPEVPASPLGMLEDPGLSRQWVLRRMQRALTLDRVGSAWRAGLAGSEPDHAGAVMQEAAAGATARADTMEALIRSVGGAAYSSIGLSPLLARWLGAGLRWLGSWAWLTLACRLARHMLSEYTNLVALIHGAAAAPPGSTKRLEPILVLLDRELKAVEQLRRNHHQRGL